MRSTVTTILLSVYCAFSFGQIVWTDPAFPTQNDQVTLYYDATEGNGDLQNVVPVYIHTGVITNLSSGPSDWQHVQGNWGTADANVLMSPEGNNVHSFDFGGQTLAQFYGLSGGETIDQLSMVFRNQSGAAVGREADGGDIYFSISDGSFSALFLTPAASSLAILPGEMVDLTGQSSESADLSVLINGSVVASASSATSIDYTFDEMTEGEYVVTLSADNGSTSIEDEIIIIVLPTLSAASAPGGTIDGINYLSGTSVVLQIHAPFKDHIFVVGDFNNWQFDLDYLMTPVPGGQRYWLQIDGLTPGQEYRFQYHILPDNMRVADVYTEKILDYWNDGFIPEVTYPNLIDFPIEGTGQDAVSVFQTNQTPFPWTDQSYEKPPKERLVIYELLLRDLVERHDYETLRDSLDYLQNLGVSAVQLMPINEFEGNISWGYNSAFFFAPDKYYGTEEALKMLVDECHNRGMAVIMDIALNHSFGSNPQVRMYFDASAGQWGQPSPQNPWFNETPRHYFNVGYDYDHSSGATKDFVKRVFKYWVDEYHIDGYRLDLSKGYTQNNTLGNIGAWNAYDQSRIDILTEYANDTWNSFPDTFFILEHFADNSEETALSNLGFMLWGNMNHDYNEASMGYPSNLSWGVHTSRGWGAPHLVTYAESHDEERLMYKNLLFGNSNGSYNITQLNTALARMELVHCFLLPLPGPKMLWQFGELGYEYSINYCNNGTINESCRTDPKPIRWDYLDVEARKRLYKVTAALANLKADYPVFMTSDFNIDLGGFGKRVHLNSSAMNVTIVGNFDVSTINMVPGFQNTGTWYDYLTGDAINVTDLNAAMSFAPGEYHVYTDVQLPTPDLSTELDEIIVAQDMLVYPNPSNGEINFHIPGAASKTLFIQVYDITGRSVFNVRQNGTDNLGGNFITLPTLTDGTYLLEVFDGISRRTARIVIKN